MASASSMRAVPAAMANENKEDTCCALHRSCDVEVFLDQNEDRDCGRPLGVLMEAQPGSSLAGRRRATPTEFPGTPVAYARSPRPQAGPLGLHSNGLSSPFQLPRASRRRPFLTSPQLHAVELKIEGPHLCDLPQDFAPRLRAFLQAALEMPPLHIAVSQGCIHLVVVLLELGRGAGVAGPAARRLHRGGAGGGVDALPARLTAFMREVLPSGSGGGDGDPGRVTVRHTMWSPDEGASDAAAGPQTQLLRPPHRPEGLHGRGGRQTSAADAAGPHTTLALLQAQAAAQAHSDPALDADSDAAAAAVAAVGRRTDSASSGNAAAPPSAARNSGAACTMGLASAGESSGGTWGSSGVGPATRSWAAWTVSPSRRAIASAASAAGSSLITSGPNTMSGPGGVSGGVGPGGGGGGGSVEWQGAEAAAAGPLPHFARSSRGVGPAFRAVAALGYVPEVPAPAEQLPGVVGEQLVRVRAATAQRQRREQQQDPQPQERWQQEPRQQQQQEQTTAVAALIGGPAGTAAAAAAALFARLPHIGSLNAALRATMASPPPQQQQQLQPYQAGEAAAPPPPVAMAAPAPLAGWQLPQGGQQIEAVSLVNPTEIAPAPPDPGPASRWARGQAATSAAAAAEGGDQQVMASFMDTFRGRPALQHGDGAVAARQPQMPYRSWARSSAGGGDDDSGTGAVAASSNTCSRSSQEAPGLAPGLLALMYGAELGGGAPAPAPLIGLRHEFGAAAIGDDEGAASSTALEVTVTAMAMAGGSSGGGGVTIGGLAAWQQPSQGGAASFPTSAGGGGDSGRGGGGGGAHDETLAFSHATLGPTLADRLGMTVGSVAGGWAGAMYPPASRVGLPPSAVPSQSQTQFSATTIGVQRSPSAVTIRPPTAGGGGTGDNGRGGGSDASARSLLGGRGGLLDLSEPSIRLLMPQVPLALVRLHSQPHNQSVELLSPSVAIWPPPESSTFGPSAAAPAVTAADSPERVTSRRPGRLGPTRLAALQQQPAAMVSASGAPSLAATTGLCIVMRCPDFIASPGGGSRRRVGGAGGRRDLEDSPSARLTLDSGRGSVGGVGNRQASVGGVAVGGSYSSSTDPTAGRGSNDRSGGLGDTPSIELAGGRRGNASEAGSVNSLATLGHVSQLVAWNRAGVVPLTQLDDSAEGCTRATLLLPQLPPPPPPQQQQPTPPAPPPQRQTSPAPAQLPQRQTSPHRQLHRIDARSLPLLRGGGGGTPARAGPAAERLRAASSAARFLAEPPTAPAGHADGGVDVGSGRMQPVPNDYGTAADTARSTGGIAATAAGLFSAGASRASAGGSGAAPAVPAPAPAVQLLYLAWRRGQSLGPPCPVLVLPCGLEDVASELQAMQPPPSQAAQLLPSYQAFLTDLGVWLEALHASSSWSLAATSAPSLTSSAAAAAAAVAGGGSGWRQRSTPSMQSTTGTISGVGTGSGTGTGSGSVPIANALALTGASPSRGSWAPPGRVLAGDAAAAAAAPWRAAAPGSASRGSTTPAARVLLEGCSADGAPAASVAAAPTVAAATAQPMECCAEPSSPFRTAAAGLPGGSSNRGYNPSAAQQQRVTSLPSALSLQPRHQSPPRPSSSQPQAALRVPSASTVFTSSSDTDERLARFTEEVFTVGCDLLIYAVARGAVATARLVMGLLMTHGSRVAQRVPLAGGAAVASGPSPPGAISSAASGAVAGGGAVGSGSASEGDGVREAVLRGVLESTRTSNDAGRTLLHFAVLSRSLPMLRLLLEVWPREYGLYVADVNRLDRAGLPPAALLPGGADGGGGDGAAMAEFAAAATAMLTALGPPLSPPDGSGAVAAGVAATPSMLSLRSGLQSVQEAGEASPRGAVVAAPWLGARGASVSASDGGGAAAVTALAQLIGFASVGGRARARGRRSVSKVEESGGGGVPQQRRGGAPVDACASAASASQEATGRPAAQLPPPPPGPWEPTATLHEGGSQLAVGQPGRPLLCWALWSATQMLLSSAQALVVLLFAMPRARALPPALSLLALPGALLWLPSMCLILSSCLSAAAVLLLPWPPAAAEAQAPPPTPPPTLLRRLVPQLPPWLPAACTSAGRALSSAMSLAGAVELARARGAASLDSGRGGGEGGGVPSLVAGGIGVGGMSGAEAIARTCCMTLAPVVLEAGYVSPTVRAMLLASEYGIPLFYVTLYDRAPAAAAWLSYAAVNVVLGVVLAGLMDLHSCRARARADAAAAAALAAAVEWEDDEQEEQEA